MPDRIDTISQDLSPQHDPSLCPPWCHREHLLTAAETDAGFHHDSDALSILTTTPSPHHSGPEALNVTCSQFVPAEGPAHLPLVEIQDDSHTVALLNPGQARELGALLIARADVLTAAALAPPAGPVLPPVEPRPYWQTEPCPTWCRGGHQADERPADRSHFSGKVATDHRIVLTLAEPMWDDVNKRFYADEPTLDVYMQQHYRETEPRAVLSVNESTGVELTLLEVDALRDALCILRAEAING